MSYFLHRLLTAAVTLFMVASLAFVLTKLAGEEAAFGEKNPTEEVRQAMKAKWGLDRPLHEQYMLQMSRLLVLDSMPSRKQQSQTLRDILREYLPSSIRLGVRALILAILLGIPVGMMCAVYHNRLVDNGGTFLALLGVSLPNFILASFAIFLSTKITWLPATGWDRPVYPSWINPEQIAGWALPITDEIFRTRLWIPAACLGAFPFAAILRLTRSSMLDVLDQDYIRTAQAKGLSNWVVIVRHGLRNALTPVVTYMGPLTAALLTGSLVVEKVFNIPGIGRFFVESVNNRDMPLILGITVFYSAFLLTMNLLVDAVYPILNPRLRKS